MALNLMMTEDEELKPRITVFGVGGAGGNAVNNMISKQLEGVEFVVANTDAQALSASLAQNRIQMGPKVTEGLGAGAKPTIGAAAAEETIEDIVDHLLGAHMCFITAGMGGGTGTGAAPIIAQAAREMGILTVGVVTKPFSFEGNRRMRQADSGIEQLQKVVDTLIIIPNQNLFRLANDKTTFSEAFVMADDVLYQGVKGVTDLMVRPGMINLDFADVRSVMDEMGKAMMGTGEGSGENRAVEAAEKAIANPLLDEVSLTGAKGVLINITGGSDLTLYELDQAANIIREKVDPDANIIVGSTLDESLDGILRISVVATGIENENKAAVAPPAAQPAAPAVPAAAPQAAQPQQPAPRAPEVQPQPSAPIETRIAEPREPAPQQQSQSAYGEMPRPAYTPQPRQPEQSLGQRISDSSADFTAPRRAQPEAQEAHRNRLQQAVQNRISEGHSARGMGHPAQQSADGGQGRMANLGRMISRMTQGGDDQRQAATLAERVNERVAHRKANMDESFDDLADPDKAKDVTDVPAFLRRQAN